MKKIKLSKSILIVIGVIGISQFICCNKNSPCTANKSCSIKYAQNGVYGPNILYGTDTLRLPENGDYSFQATIPKGGTLKIEMELISGDGWGYETGSNVGWAINDFDFTRQIQTFNIINPGTADVKIVKWPGTDKGINILKFYENSTNETRRKVIIWI